MGWGTPLGRMIETTIRENHERFYKGLSEMVLEYLADKGLLVRYSRDYTFPGTDYLPSEEEIEEHTKRLLDKLYKETP